MTDDGPYEEAMVGHSLTSCHFSRAQVQVHPVVLAGEGADVKVAQPIDLQLEGQGGLQMAVDGVFLKPTPGSEREVLGEGVLEVRGMGTGHMGTGHMGTGHMGTEDTHDNMTCHLTAGAQIDQPL